VKMASQGLLVIKGSRTGLGDRIRAVLVGLLYAEVSNRCVYVDWRDGMYGPAGENVFDRFFTIERIVSAAAPDLANDVAPAAWAGRLGKSMDEAYAEDGAPPWDRQKAVERYSVDMGRMDHPQAVVVSWEFTQLSKIRPFLPRETASLSDEQVESWAWQRYLKLKPEIADVPDRYFPPGHGTSIGVHIRSTREFAQAKGELPLGRYIESLDRILAKCDVRSIYVATDNEDVLRAMKTRYPAAVSRPKWFAAPGDALHLHGSCPDKLMMATDALVEMAMLARCAWLVSIDNSSYSIAARVMSAAPARQRITLSASRPLWDRIWRRAVRLGKRFGTFGQA
jgi:hypothetical protein